MLNALPTGGRVAPLQAGSRRLHVPVAMRLGRAAAGPRAMQMAPHAAVLPRASRASCSRPQRQRNLQVNAFFKNIFKQDPSENTRKKYGPLVDTITAMEPQMQALSDEQLRGKTAEFKARVQRGESLDALLPEAFAVRARPAAGQRSHSSSQPRGSPVRPSRQ